MTPLQMALPEPPARNRPRYLATAEPAAFGDGFYAEEVDGLDRYRWMASAGSLCVEPAPVDRFLEAWVLSEFHDLSQTLTATHAGPSETFALIAGWSPLSIEVPAGADRVDLRVNKLFPRAYYPGDARELSIRVRGPVLHRDPLRHGHIRRQHDNAVHNVREQIEGRTSLESTPPTLGIDLYGVCNVKPPCVYCEWDASKAQEGAFVNAPFTVDTLREWGPFFDNSVSLVNCSIGEPFMMKAFDDLLDAFGDGGKVLEMTTNGQILTDRNIQKLLGRPIDLYISLDAGTRETYAKLRNDRFDTILGNLRRLIAAKGGRGPYPHVHLVFMPMRVNVHELEGFVRLCADLQVDRLVLRQLNDSPSVGLDWERAGHHFQYQKELLPFDELVRASGRAAGLCRRYGVELADQMDFGGAMGPQFETWFEEGRRSAGSDPPGSEQRGSEQRGSEQRGSEQQGSEQPGSEQPGSEQPGSEQPGSDPGGAEPLPSLGRERKPICTEPWKSLYILRRGVLPCCYGGAPIAPMDQYREAWNGPLVRDIRAALVQGQFHDYCLRSFTCPIVKKAAEAQSLPWPHRARLRLRRAAASLRTRLRPQRATEKHRKR